MPGYARSLGLREESESHAHLELSLLVYNSVQLLF
jgi:hypothetical protein